MALLFDDLRVLRSAEAFADEIWHQVIKWDTFARDTIGGHLTRATDSIGANIAESYGRYHFSEKLQFLYYARGSLFESKYWVNRSLSRQLITQEMGALYADKLSALALELNTFAKTIKDQRTPPATGKALREIPILYTVDNIVDIERVTVEELFTNQELQSLKQLFPE